MFTPFLSALFLVASSAALLGMLHWLNGRRRWLGIGAVAALSFAVLRQAYATPTPPLASMLTERAPAADERFATLRARIRAAERAEREAARHSREELVVAIAQAETALFEDAAWNIAPSGSSIAAQPETVHSATPLMHPPGTAARPWILSGT